MVFGLGFPRGWKTKNRLINIGVIGSFFHRPVSPVTLIQAKTHYLFYPDEKGRFYFGPGVGVVRGALKIKNPFAVFGRSRMPRYGIKPTIEGLIGYEWPSSIGRPCFLQLEVGVSYSRKMPFYPVVSFGLGF